MNFSSITIFFVAIVLTCTRAGASTDPAGVEFFEKKIRPVLTDNCYKCHSRESTDVKGGLLLDSRESLLRGGASGPAIVPGDPEKSILIKAIRYTNAELQMPPKGRKLSAEQIANLEEWVRLGAPDPRVGASSLPTAGTIESQAMTHWAFRPLNPSSPPSVKNKRWPKTEIDLFVLAKLESKDLKPSAMADRRTLIRRAYFDLTGLPPTHEEVEAFVANRSSNAFVEVIDRLLASPRYGERWGRHWLDVARYADTKGYLAGNEERRFPYSYTYRDWVIRSFNEDLPYDQFITAQIAADQLNLGDDKRALAAMGFLTLGRRFLNNKHDIIDDRIDVVTRGTLGLTVSCARCHDHKYDPIPTADYYSLYGVFDSSYEPPEQPLLGIEPPKEPHEAYLIEKKRREDAVTAFTEQKSTEILNQLRSQVGDYLLAVHELQQQPDETNKDTFARERKLDPGVLQRWADSLAAWSTPTNAIFSPWFIFSTIPSSEFTNKSAAIAATFSAPGSTINPRITKLFSETPQSMADVAKRYGTAFAEVDKEWRHLVEEQTKTDSALPPVSLADENSEALRAIIHGTASPLNLSRGEIDRLFDVPAIERRRELRRQVAELDAIHPGAPPRGMVLMDKESPAKPRIFIRGNASNPGNEVPRQFLAILAGPERRPFQQGSGRLELAQAITSKTNPLTARVIVNRVWMMHFGKGLVTTPSDFGLRSDPPSHPELLDWLAWNFMESGWSLKKLHRQIMLSSVYQQISNEDKAAANVDPGNVFLWRMNRHRLEFESMRDSLLAVSGQLDLSVGGQPVDIVSQPFSGRRSIYGHIDRQNLPGVLRTFDFANPDSTSPQRFFTTVPQQALFLLNSPFVVEQARVLATNVLTSKAIRDADRIEGLYRRVLQREPERREIKAGEAFLKQQMSIIPMPVNKSPWQYGYGEFDARTNRVVQFTAFPQFKDNRWQQSDTFPDPQLAYAMLSTDGGHPGNRAHQAVIRRWVSPFDGTIQVEGELFHPIDQGDGVLGRIISSRHGELGQWPAFNGRAQTIVKTAEVRRGDFLDFVTEMQAGPTHDSFKWAPQIKVIEVRYGTPNPPRIDWNATRDFSGPLPDVRPLTAWEKFAQVLLLSNEFMFVD